MKIKKYDYLTDFPANIHMDDFDERDFHLFKVSEDLVSTAESKNVKISTAEDFTGGMIASSICSISGVYEVFHTGIIARHKDTKSRLLNIPLGEITPHEIVQDMARNLVEKEYEISREVEENNFGVAVTNIIITKTKERETYTIFIGLSNKKNDCYPEVEVYKVINLPNILSHNSLRAIVSYIAMSLLKNYIEQELPDNKEKKQ